MFWHMHDCFHSRFRHYALPLMPIVGTTLAWNPKRGTMNGVNLIINWKCGLQLDLPLDSGGFHLTDWCDDGNIRDLVDRVNSDYGKMKLGTYAGAVKNAKPPPFRPIDANEDGTNDSSDEMDGYDKFLNWLFNGNDDD